MNNNIPDQDQSESLAAQVSSAAQRRQALSILGGNSKAFMGHKVEAEPMNVSAHTGIVNYQPDELVIKVRAGTSVADLQQHLAKHQQQLPFEPPLFNASATIGGTIACNASGPARPYLGAARDFVLGVQMINGLGQICRFGGEVMKNVAGYDVSRLMTGAMGTLGVLLDVSIKILPLAHTEQTRILEMSDVSTALQWLARQSGQWPLTAACYTGQRLYLRLAGSEAGVAWAAQQIGGQALAANDPFWQQLREQQLAFFNDSRPLWRLSVAPMTPAIDSIEGDTLYDWGGAQRWLLSNAADKDIRDWALQYGGHASCLRNRPPHVQVHQPLAPALATLQQSLQQSFDPYHILNPGRLYPEAENC